MGAAHQRPPKGLHGRYSLLEDDRLLGRRVWVRYYKDEILSGLRLGWRRKTGPAMARSLHFFKIAAVEVGRWLIYWLRRARWGSRKITHLQLRIRTRERRICRSS